MKQDHPDWAGLEPPKGFRYPSIKVVMSADNACFTRPDSPAERISYPVATPSALTGALSAVLWKPQFRWVIEQVDVLSPIRMTTSTRNEIKNVQGMKNLGARYNIDDDGMRVQRTSLVLQNVVYRVHANIWVHPAAREQDPAKWRDQFQRRLRKGQYYTSPYLGVRECIADLRPDDPALQPIRHSENLGVMLHSIDYKNDGTEVSTWFHASLINGSMTVPRQGLFAATVTA